MRNIFRRILCCLITLMLLALTSTANMADASLLESKVMSIREVPKMGYGNISNTNFSLGGDSLQLNVKSVNRNSSHISGGHVRLMSRNGSQDYLSFPVENCPYFEAYKFATGGEEFLLVKGGRSGASDSVCTGLWVVGKHKGSIVSFVALDRLKQAGLIFDDIAAEMSGGELRLIGITRDRNCQNGYYKGHRVRSYDKAYCAVNEVRLFWDKSAQWFGLRLVN